MQGFRICLRSFPVAIDGRSRRKRLGLSIAKPRIRLGNHVGCDWYHVSAFRSQLLDRTICLLWRCRLILCGAGDRWADRGHGIRLGGSNRRHLKSKADGSGSFGSNCHRSDGCVYIIERRYRSLILQASYLTFRKPHLELNQNLAIDVLALDPV